ncbi:hypothetical protein C2845_PM01G03500 [Panicum miliaceum]|uniref:Uncharacterized protein n=1 Tax=Panicum miliaceum TaxID=4540 RepID=A0A3L6THR1_PANMI|nr:hypothetical protein C2845_PM01G03500 [Panicum miliaceum]
MGCATPPTPPAKIHAKPKAKTTLAALASTPRLVATALPTARSIPSLLDRPPIPVIAIYN